jgi:hypothetical protein
MTDKYTGPITLVMWSYGKKCPTLILKGADCLQLFRFGYNIEIPVAYRFHQNSMVFLLWSAYAAENAAIALSKESF